MQIQNKDIVSVARALLSSTGFEARIEGIDVVRPRETGRSVVGQGEVRIIIDGVATFWDRDGEAEMIQFGLPSDDVRDEWNKVSASIFAMFCNGVTAESARVFLPCRPLTFAHYWRVLSELWPLVARDFWRSTESRKVLQDLHAARFEAQGATARARQKLSLVHLSERCWK